MDPNNPQPVVNAGDDERMLVDDAISGQEVPPGHISSGVSDIVGGIDIDADGSDSELLQSPVREDDESSVTTVGTARNNPLDDDDDDDDDKNRLIIAEPTTSNDFSTPQGGAKAIAGPTTSNDLNSNAQPTPVKVVNDGFVPPPQPESTETLVGKSCDYVPALLVVDDWQFAPNPPGVSRLPFHGIESQVNRRMTQPTKQQLSELAIRNDLK